MFNIIPAHPIAIFSYYETMNYWLFHNNSTKYLFKIPVDLFRASLLNLSLKYSDNRALHFRFIFYAVHLWKYFPYVILGSCKCKNVLVNNIFTVHKLDKQNRTCYISCKRIENCNRNVKRLTTNVKVLPPLFPAGNNAENEVEHHPYLEDKECPRKPELIKDRKCLKKCRNDLDCRGRNKKCLCDDVCGKSCVKPSKYLLFARYTSPSCNKLICLADEW